MDFVENVFANVIAGLIVSIISGLFGAFWGNLQKTQREKTIPTPKVTRPAHKSDNFILDAVALLGRFIAGLALGYGIFFFITMALLILYLIYTTLAGIDNPSDPLSLPLFIMLLAGSILFGMYTVFSGRKENRAPYINVVIVTVILGALAIGMISAIDIFLLTPEENIFPRCLIPLIAFGIFLYLVMQNKYKEP